ncbi:hypothetical protein ASPSYDRAFT_47429 [Aspergillus sydowii CBS 593.65]|uniref:NAD(P)-binding domain-containing protein n=1 Tax=Aspergillus sydowii CBS 593.65 TaxID=1036612 RepID=A0A1L9TCI8_9EURO|nr:uncharacterized protein ASPSYDRAFT_47429 [Aspergillus sydowii CBS 593.65]OJJ57137.1 hypothetical protein ASPSYDRAFT_47429 [Aspergillus sydowii CBS 593.65]
MQTVLVLGATGNIGVAAVKAALRTGRNVLAIVRNQNSADKLVHHVGSKEGITFVEADVLSDSGVQGVVDQVLAGKLPAFQHVYSCVGGEYVQTPLTEITTERFRLNVNSMFEAAFYGYRATIPYLRSQSNPTTWTLCTGASGDWGTHALPAMTQGALFSFSIVAARETADTNVRFNEAYLALRVEVDEDAAVHGVSSASEYAAVYEAILDREDIRGSRVGVWKVEDMKDLKVSPKF